MPLNPGQKLGHYEITAAIGAGGMGEVYKATDTRLDRTVALKIMPDHVALNAELRGRFQREAKAISSLNHPNICTLHDVGHEDVRADGSAPPEVFLKTQFSEWDGVFSPDGRWLAFTSEETGREEVSVTAFPEAGSKWQVSIDEGERPRWSADGKLLYYLDNDDHLNVAEVDASGSAFVVGQVRQLHELNTARPGSIYDLFPDGERLLINHRLGSTELTRLVLVQNWPEELK